jgi:hypothetical protein
MQRLSACRTRIGRVRNIDLENPTIFLLISFKILISIEVNWLKVKTQIEILRRIAAAGQLSKELQSMQSQVLSQLEGKLKTGSWIIEQLNPKKCELEPR